MESGHWIIPANERFIMGAECESLLPEKGEESRLVRRVRLEPHGVCLGWYAGKKSDALAPLMRRKLYGA